MAFEFWSFGVWKLDVVGFEEGEKTIYYCCCRCLCVVTWNVRWNSSGSCDKGPGGMEVDKGYRLHA